jgi:hypothetical protein
MEQVWQAEQSARIVFREAGVDTAWVECPTVSSPSPEEAVCAGGASPSILMLNLLPESMAPRLNLRYDAFGVAIEPPGGIGYMGSVFYEKAKDYALRVQIDLAPFLGAVIAHELGHLLLGTHSHSADGRMRATWSSKQLHLAEQRGLVFSPSEAERVRKGVAGRSQAALREDVSAAAPSPR